jgi:uncharacterized membrane protein YeaQ/YmgE (transglycosylase-associated protein family)
MNILTSLVVGVVVGWLASMLMRTSSREGLLRNVTAGVAGAYLGGWILHTLWESADTQGFSFGMVVAASIGAATLLFLVKRFVGA